MMALVKCANLLKCCNIVMPPIHVISVRHLKWPYDWLLPVEYNKVVKLDDIANSEYKHMLYAGIRSATQHEVYSLFHDPIVSKFTRKAMRRGQKAIMRLLVEQTFATIKHTQLQKYNAALNSGNLEEAVKIECNPLVIFHKALENCRPMLITRGVKRGGATYQVPYPLTETVSRNLAMKWLIDMVKDRPRPRTAHFPEVMGNELIEAYYNEGRVVRKKQEMHRQCEANKAYAHYRWG